MHSTGSGGKSVPVEKDTEIPPKSDDFGGFVLEQGTGIELQAALPCG